MLPSPLGPVLLKFSSRGLASLEFLAVDVPLSGNLPESWPVFIQETVAALAAYFAGAGSSFSSLPLDMRGTPFQLRVWQELQTVPCGHTLSYQDLAAGLGKPRACRAVGQALKANPIPVIIPCHRIIAQDGSLGGYRPGVARKRWLLEHEQQMWVDNP